MREVPFLSIKRYIYAEPYAHLSQTVKEREKQHN